jgi:hypothetical protein
MILGIEIPNPKHQIPNNIECSNGECTEQKKFLNFGNPLAL